jgi:hypothetical protein
VTVLGSELNAGDHVRLQNTWGEWEVLPRVPGDELRFLGRHDGSLVPIVDSDMYEVLD